MGAFAAGFIVLIPFPFSDLSQSKRRPAVVLAQASRNDWILCQVTSNAYADVRAIRLADSDFVTGSLRLVSYARPEKLFTAHESLVVAVVGALRSVVLETIQDKTVAIFQGRGGVPWSSIGR